MSLAQFETPSKIKAVNELPKSINILPKNEGKVLTISEGMTICLIVIKNHLSKLGLDPALSHPKDELDDEHILSWYNYKEEYCSISVWTNDQVAMYSSHYQGKVIETATFLTFKELADFGTKLS